MSCQHHPSPNPRVDTCVRCGRRMEKQEARPRNLPLERHLTEMVSEGNPLAAAHLSAFADHRAWPGGVWPKDLVLNAKEEAADLRNYLVWHIEPFWQGYLDGDADASKEVARSLSALAALVELWRCLNT